MLFRSRDLQPPSRPPRSCRQECQAAALYRPGSVCKEQERGGAVRSVGWPLSTLSAADQASDTEQSPIRLASVSWVLSLLFLAEVREAWLFSF